MANYLDKFNSTVKKNQTDQIFKLLSKQRSIGQIRTVEEFTKKLDELIRNLVATELTPTLKLIPAQSHDIADSDSFNHTLERVEDDLSTAFTEAHNIGEVQIAHEAIVRDVVLKNIQHGIAELDSKIALYEFLSGDANGFSTAIFSTFRESKEERTNRTTDTTDLFVDPKSSNTSAVRARPVSSAEIDTIGERLILAFSDSDKIVIRGIDQIFDPDTQASQKYVTRPGTTVANILDATAGTYWVESILTDTDSTAKQVTVKLELKLAGTRSINFIEIVPANVHDFTLSNIYYLDGTGVVQLLESPALSIDRPVTHIFPAVSTSRLILEFTIITSKRVNFIIENGAPLITQAVEQSPVRSSPSASDVRATTDSIPPANTGRTPPPTGSTPPPRRPR